MERSEGAAKTATGQAATTEAAERLSTKVECLADGLAALAELGIV